MKNIVSSVVVMILLCSAAGCSSGRYVSSQPQTVVVTRPTPPYPNYIWVDGGYYRRGGRYMYRQGYWAPPRGPRVYRQGTWVSTPRGYYYRKGGWARPR